MPFSLRFKRGRRPGFLLALFCLLGLAACEPTQVEPAYYGTLTVTVLDGTTNQPLANVAVSTTPATGSFVTDAKGQVTIAQVAAGPVSVALARGRDRYVQIPCRLRRRRVPVHRRQPRL